MTYLVCDGSTRLTEIEHAMCKFLNFRFGQHPTREGMVDLGNLMQRCMIPCIFMKEDTPMDVMVAIGNGTYPTSFQFVLVEHYLCTGRNLESQCKLISGFDVMVCLTSWYAAKMEINPSQFNERISLLPRSTRKQWMYLAKHSKLALQIWEKRDLGLPSHKRAGEPVEPLNMAKLVKIL